MMYCNKLFNAIYTVAGYATPYGIFAVLPRKLGRLGSRPNPPQDVRPAPYFSASQAQ